MRKSRPFCFSKLTCQSHSYSLAIVMNYDDNEWYKKYGSMMCNNMKNISKDSGNRIDIIRFWSLMSLISLKPSIAEEFFGSW